MGEAARNANGPSLRLLTKRDERIEPGSSTSSLLESKPFAALDGRSVSGSCAATTDAKNVALREPGDTSQFFSSSASKSLPGADSDPGDGTNPGDGTDPGDGSAPELLRPLPIPGRGRSYIRKCSVVQDGHSLAEEAIYQYMFRTARVDAGDPAGSRTVRVGDAEIGCAVKLSKKNVRKNITQLQNKRSIELLKNFESSSSRPRLYRVLTYSQILERRKAAGLQYVLRNRGVVFCSEQGKPIDIRQAGPTVTNLRPLTVMTDSLGERVVVSGVLPCRRAPTAAVDGQGIAMISAELNAYRYVDETAASNLLAHCRRVRADASNEEIASLVREKLYSASRNPKISDPIGLILKTLPRCLFGEAFESFRRRLVEQNHQAIELARAKAEEQLEFAAWLSREQEHLARIASDPNKSEEERRRATKDLETLEIP